MNKQVITHFFLISLTIINSKAYGIHNKIRQRHKKPAYETIQLAVTPQSNNTCGIHAACNVLALDILIRDKKAITSANVKELSETYFDIFAQSCPGTFTGCDITDPKYFKTFNKESVTKNIIYQPQHMLESWEVIGLIRSFKNFLGITPCPLVHIISRYNNNNIEVADSTEKKIPSYQNILKKWYVNRHRQPIHFIYHDNANHWISMSVVRSAQGKCIIYLCDSLAHDLTDNAIGTLQKIGTDFAL